MALLYTDGINHHHCIWLWWLQVQAIVRKHNHIRVNGGGHSFNDFVCSSEAMIETNNMSGRWAKMGQRHSGPVTTIYSPLLSSAVSTTMNE